MSFGSSSIGFYRCGVCSYEDLRGAKSAMTDVGSVLRAGDRRASSSSYDTAAPVSNEFMKACHHSPVTRRRLTIVLQKQQDEGIEKICTLSLGLNLTTNTNKSRKV